MGLHAAKDKKAKKSDASADSSIQFDKNVVKQTKGDYVKEDYLSTSTSDNIKTHEQWENFKEFLININLSNRSRHLVSTDEDTVRQQKALLKQLGKYASGIMDKIFEKKKLKSITHKAQVAYYIMNHSKDYSDLSVNRRELLVHKMKLAFDEVNELDSDEFNNEYKVLKKEKKADKKSKKKKSESSASVSEE